MSSKEQDQHQALALSAVFQASILADQVASSGRCDQRALRVLLDSVLNLEPEHWKDVYADHAALADGRELLRNALSGNQTRESVRPVGYALGLMHLAGRLRKDQSLMSVLRNRLEALQAQRPHFDDAAGPEFCNRLAGIYLDTLGSLRFRIKVQGEPEHLRNEDNAARIRAIFLAGVRAAFLWHQAGGRRWHLLLTRRRLLAALEDLS